MKTFKYRLQPSESQRTKLIQTLELCRWVYKETLATRKNAWEQEHQSSFTVRYKQVAHHLETGTS